MRVRGDLQKSTKKAHGVLGVESSNLSVPTNKINDLGHFERVAFFISGDWVLNGYSVFYIIRATP